MSADQNRDKKPPGKSTGDKGHDDKRLKEKHSETEQSLHRRVSRNDEEKTDRTDYGEQIGEFSNWSKGSRIG